MWFSRSLRSIARVSSLSSPLGHRACAPMAFSTSSSFHDTEAVTQRVLEIVRKYPKVTASKVTPTANFQKDLGLDSLDAIELVVNIENEFDVMIPDAEADKIATVEDAIKFIAGLPVIPKLSADETTYSRPF